MFEHFLIARGYDVSSGEESACFFLTPLDDGLLNLWREAAQVAGRTRFVYGACRSSAIAVRFDDDLWLEPLLSEDGWTLIPFGDLVGHACTTLAHNGVEVWTHPSWEGAPAGVRLFTRLPSDGINAREVYWSNMLDFSSLSSLLDQ